MKPTPTVTVTLPEADPIPRYNAPELTLPQQFAVEALAEIAYRAGQRAAPDQPFRMALIGQQIEHFIGALIYVAHEVVNDNAGEPFSADMEIHIRNRVRAAARQLVEHTGA